MPPGPLPFEILLHDDHLLVVNKPAGIAVEGERTPGVRTLRQLLQEKLGYLPRLVHNLDKGTSGVLLFARTLEAQRSLCHAFFLRRVRKVYQAVVIGVPPRDEDLIDLPLAEDPLRQERMITDRHGKPSQTRFRILEKFSGYSLLELMPITGRTHQIRVHLAAVGHPLAVDPYYGETEGVFLSSLKSGYKFKAGVKERPLIDRLTLHAFSATFRHPFSKQEVTFSCPLPDDFNLLLDKLRKYKRC